MALQKVINLPNATSGSYIRLTGYRWERISREASAIFSLYSDATQAGAAPAQPVCPVIAKLRIDGADFDVYLAASVLTGDVTAVGQLYRAAKAMPLIVGGGLTELTLSDAEDV